MESDDATGFFGPVLLARDFDATVTFYRTLGFTIAGNSPYAKCISSPSSFSIADGEWWAEVNGKETPVQGETATQSQVLLVDVENLEAAFERLMAAGLKFLSPPMERRQLGIHNAFLRDPDGRMVMLKGPPTSPTDP